MHRLAIPIITMVLCTIGAPAASAAVLGIYTFTGLTDLPAPASSVDPLVNISDLTEGAGSTFSVVNNPNAQTSGDVMRFFYNSAANTTEADSVAADQYLEFTVTPLDAIVDFSTIAWIGSADTTTGSRSFTFFVRTSLDDYATTLDSDTRTSSFPQYAADLDISSLSGITAPITIRMYYHDNNNSGGQVFIDDLSINGTVAIIPEPASLALAGTGLLLLARRRPGHAR